MQPRFWLDLVLKHLSCRISSRPRAQPCLDLSRSLLVRVVVPEKHGMLISLVASRTGALAIL